MSFKNNIMTASAIQKYISQNIIDIDDDLILNQIKKLIDSKKHTVYELSHEQVLMFNESQKQYANGEFIDDLEMDKKVEQWQKGK